MVNNVVTQKSTTSWYVQPDPSLVQCRAVPGFRFKADTASMPAAVSQVPGSCYKAALVLVRLTHLFQFAQGFMWVAPVDRLDTASKPFDDGVQALMIFKQGPSFS
jgi:hypothetical protein